MGGASANKVRNGKWWRMIFVAPLILIAGIGPAAAPQARITVLGWDNYYAASSVAMAFDETDHPKLAELRQTYGLAKIAGSGSDLIRAVRLCRWVHRQWRHNGNNQPSAPDALTILAEARAGRRFRCVEYAVVLAQAAQSLGMPARVVNLRRANVAYGPGGSGHVTAEIWLASLNRWVFFDPQWNLHAHGRDGQSLSTIGLARALRDRLPVRFVGTMGAVLYQRWIEPYLHFIGFSLDQRICSAYHGPALFYVPSGSSPFLTFQGTPAGPAIFTRDDRLLEQGPAVPADSTAGAVLVLTYTQTVQPGLSYIVSDYPAGIAGWEVGLDGGPVEERPAVFTWILHEGVNSLRARPILASGERGLEAVVEIGIE